MARLFLTGGSGLIGSHAAALFRDRGWRVRALVRPRSHTAHLEDLGCELVIGDVTDPRTLSGAADGCDVVLHGAAHLGSSAPWKRYRSVNVDGTRNVLAEAIRAGARRFVHLSSVAVYGSPGDQPTLPIVEDAPTDTPLREEDYYERSKRMAEEVVRRVGGDGIEWTLLRPAVVMGERDRLFTPRLVDFVDRDVGGRTPVVLVGDGENPLPVLYARDLADACRLAASETSAAGRVYNVSGDGALTQRQLFAEAAPARPLFLVLPPPVAAAAVRGAGALARLVPGRPRPLVNRRRLWFLAHTDPFSSRRIRDELGWAPRVGSREGWRRAVAWQLRRP